MPPRPAASCWYGGFLSRPDLIDKLDTYVISDSTTVEPAHGTGDGAPLKVA